MHGGRVEAASDGPGQGSEFTVRLPRLAAEAAQPSRSPCRRRRRPGPRRRVLVVDDNQDAADRLALFLRLRGHDVRTAARRAEAPRGDRALHARRGVPRPGAAGDERLRAWRGGCGRCRAGTAPGWWRSPATGRTRTASSTRDAGFDVHLAKPVDPRAVDALLAEAS